jgi:prevent-host-death family protein
MKSVTTHQAKTQLSQLIEQVRAGEEIVILRGSVPVARLVPFHGGENPEAPRRPRIGTLTSEPVHCSPDAFAPMGDEELSEWGL